MTNWQKRQRRREEVKSRAKNPNSMYGYCRILGCGKPARAGTLDGLDERHCRAHADHFQRHGSAIKGSYSAATLKPHRTAALEWLRANGDDPVVKSAVAKIRRLYDRAGPHVEAFRLRGLSPEERAKAAWARLRKDEVDPVQPLAAWLAVELAIAADPQPVKTREFKLVQAAKLVHRMSSGSHRRWEHGVAFFGGDGKSVTRSSNQLHVYPKSRGRVLWWIGADLEKSAELLAHTYAKAPIS